MIELIVYLGIVISVLLLNLALIKVVNLSNPAENAFWDSMADCWNEMTVKSQIYHTSYRVELNSDRVVFVPKNRQLKVKSLRYPRDLQIAQYVQINVADDGFVSPRTIHWYSKDGREKYQQKIQLGWSGYRLKKME
ncbi:prepilin-type cleavage methylation protein [Lentilactobacillus kisonensis DSM 19906 = JCM 15041]|nr:prepilin-type cleavage methylation protein [Lentilactobacillus kisonensis DSM 19906 = JCM 15041]